MNNRKIMTIEWGKIEIKLLMKISIKRKVKKIKLKIFITM
jgi:hypothetical protein